MCLLTLMRVIRSRFYLEMLPVPQLLMKFPHILRNQILITMFTFTCLVMIFTATTHKSPSKPDQSCLHSPIPPFRIYFHDGLPSTSRPSKLSLSIRFSHRNPECIPLCSHVYYMPCPSQPP